ncbi:MAG: UDP-N-acetylmuramoyl-L-alanyl-D-glutamate--2,6-diaminopimelate ligase [Candidatus Riflebacteria bacterium]|nr:UDP-N-acetylmuramoyl-L-alanyl-D-glutamate--2,6-diaminopimelate ligase [Candidatus Riflebacteria bacterium]
MKNLQSILPSDILEIQNNRDAAVYDVTCDSRNVTRGAFFVALSGAKADGSEFINEAIRKGACAVICEKVPQQTDVPCIRVPNARKALSEVASKFFDHPDRKATIFGITGTKGKTTSSYLIQSILKSHFGMAFRFGTVEYDLWFDKRPAKNTTPESVEIFRLLDECLKRDVRSGVMEVSSHALKTWRVENLALSAAGFSNLSLEHTEFHPTMQDYFEAKKRLFTELLPDSSPAVVFIDDEWGEKLAEDCKSAGKNIVTVSVSNQSANFFAHNISFSPTKTQFSIMHRGKSFPLSINLPGPFNLKNALLSATLTHSTGIDLETIAYGLEKVTNVPGRFETISNTKNLMVVVDYAHSPDSLKNVIEAARAMTEKRIITVFGCGGDRSHEKRPIMGKIAASLADVVIVTSDNPRSEDPEKIISEISAGIDKIHPVDRAVVHKIPDRKSAIETAINMAHPGDIVLIAGKGHESGQIFSDHTIPFDDRKVAREVLEKSSQ